MMPMIAGHGDANPLVLWLAVVGAAILIAFLGWWLVTRRRIDPAEREREHHRDADWGSLPSDAMEL